MNPERKEFLEKLRQLREEAKDGAGMPDEIANKVVVMLAVTEEIAMANKPKP